MLNHEESMNRLPVVIEDFNDLHDLGASKINANEVHISLVHHPEYVRFGTSSLRLEYDFSDTVGTSGAYLEFKGKGQTAHRLLEGYPQKIGVWVYGDGGKHWLRGLIVDGAGESKPLDFTLRGELNWKGWKYVAASVPEGLQLPISLAQIYIVEIENSNKNKGLCYFDTVRAEYGCSDGDWTGPDIVEFTPKPGQTVYSTAPVISARILDDDSGVDAESLRMTLDGREVAGVFHSNSGLFKFQAGDLSDGEHTVTVEARDVAGNPANPHAEWSFAVFAGPDQIAPKIRVISPLPEVSVITNTPRIAVQVSDDHTGVDYSQVKLWLDGKEVDLQIDENSETVYYTCADQMLPSSVHKVKISAMDKAGNASAYEWSFSVGKLPGQPQNPHRYQMTVIGDGGYYLSEQQQVPRAPDILLKEQIARINREPSEIIGYTGDIVENDTAENFAAALKNMNMFQKPYLIAIGNHEVSGTGSRANYQRTFGDPTFIYDYGNTKFIVLDAASGDITKSDASQWPWLQQMLWSAEQQNIFIFIHVPPDQISATGENFNTGHGFMNDAEAQRFYDLIGTYKREHPAKNIIVFSGDFHVYQHKVVQDVDYIISGGGGKQAHVSHEKGGFYHYLNVIVDGDSVIWEVIPLLEAIEFSEDEILLAPGDELKLQAVGRFLTDTNKPISMPVDRPFKTEWFSDQPSSVEVDAFGVVIARQPGEALISVKCGWQSAQQVVKVINK